MERGRNLLAALQELNELSSAVEEQGERSAETVTAQAERFALARRIRDVVKELESAATAYADREEERLWRLMEAAGVKSARVELAEGDRMIVRSHQVFPGLNYDVVDRTDPAAKREAREKIMEFLRQTGDAEELVDETPRIRWTRARRKEYRERWLKAESEGELVIPPELDLHPRPQIQFRKA
jgi:sugar-specific transcriptional regulator TrmB